MTRQPDGEAADTLRAKERRLERVVEVLRARAREHARDGRPVPEPLSSSMARAGSELAQGNRGLAALAAQHERPSTTVARRFGRRRAPGGPSAR
jgi:hypothetical protein